MRYILIILCFVVGGSLFSQSKKGTIKVSKKEIEEEYVIGAQPETFPQFPGGDSVMYAFLNKHIHYTDSAKMANIQGNVYVQFTIDTNGNIKNAFIPRGLGYGLDENALNTINKMPKWIPGKILNKKVEMKYTIPIRYYMN